MHFNRVSCLRSQFCCYAVISLKLLKNELEKQIRMGGKKKSEKLKFTLVAKYRKFSPLSKYTEQS
jgi:hypothetical protein